MSVKIDIHKSDKSGRATEYKTGFELYTHGYTQSSGEQTGCPIEEIRRFVKNSLAKKCPADVQLVDLRVGETTAGYDGREMDWKLYVDATWLFSCSEDQLKKISRYVEAGADTYDRDNLYWQYGLEQIEFFSKFNISKKILNIKPIQDIEKGVYAVNKAMGELLKELPDNFEYISHREFGYTW